MKCFKHFLLLLLLNCQLSAELYFVRIDGNDANSGLENTAGKAWQTLQKAFENVEPGDQVFVGNGTYQTNGFFFEDVHGTAENPIVVAALNQHEAKLTRSHEANPDRSVVEFRNSSYIVLDGFEIYDTLEGMESGVDVRDCSHHITVRNCYIHDCACGGISSRLSDYLVFEHNVVRDNSKRNKWNCSGISIWHAVELDQKPGYHIIIRKNVSFENECALPFTPLGFDHPTDGNGIIIDDFRSKQEVAKGQPGGYKAAVLIENNLTFNNGGRGINIYESENVTVRNNTSFHNMRIVSAYESDFGEITVQNSSNCKVYNNIIIPNPEYGIFSLATHCYNSEESADNQIFNNLMVGEPDYCGQGLQTTDNLILPADTDVTEILLDPTVEVATIDVTELSKKFGLSPLSPARDAASSTFVPCVDILNRKRTHQLVDIGCFEEPKTTGAINGGTD